jgi:hypothetical protein
MNLLPPYLGQKSKEDKEKWFTYREEWTLSNHVVPYETVLTSDVTSDAVYLPDRSYSEISH